MNEDWPETIEFEMPTAQGPRPVIITMEAMAAQARIMALEDACQQLRGHVQAVREARHRAERRVAFWRVVAVVAVVVAVASIPDEWRPLVVFALLLVVGGVNWRPRA